MVVAAGLDDKFYRAAQLGVGVGDGLHVCGEGNGAVGVAAYGHYGYARLSQPRQGLQRHAGERRVGLFVPDTPFREQSGPQVLLPPARPAQHVAYGRVDVDAGHLVRVARGIDERLHHVLVRVEVGRAHREVVDGPPLGLQREAPLVERGKDLLAKKIEPLRELHDGSFLERSE